MHYLTSCHFHEISLLRLREAIRYSIIVCLASILGIIIGLWTGTRPKGSGYRPIILSVHQSLFQDPTFPMNGHGRILWAKEVGWRSPRCTLVSQRAGVGEKGGLASGVYFFPSLPRNMGDVIRLMAGHDGERRLASEL